MPTDHQGLRGKVAIITGSSRGIGRGIAVHLARHGAKIAVNYLKNVDACSPSLSAKGGCYEIAGMALFRKVTHHNGVYRDW